MSETQKGFLIKHGWSYTGRPPHLWRDPESKWPTNVEETLYLVSDAVAIQSAREGVAPPQSDQNQPATVEVELVFKTIDTIDALFAEADCELLSPERMALHRLRDTLEREILLTDPRKRSAGLLGIRNKSRSDLQSRSNHAN
jgi:hypothetical protein